MNEFYFTAEIINGYDFKNNPHNYRHFLIELPITKEDLQAAFEEIGLDITARPGEYYLGTKNFELYHIPKAGRLFTDNENIDELNFLAGLLSNLDREEYDAFVAAVESYEHTECVADMINLAANIDNYTFIPDIDSWEEYGRWKLREDGIDLDELGDLVDYIDFDEYGEYRGRNENAQLTDDGILEKCDRFYERYNGDLNTIPKEYSITTNARAEQELQDSMVLAVFVDTYLREHHPDYDRMYSQIQETQESILDNLLSGKTHKLKIVFEEMGLTEKDTPFKEFSEYEKKYPKKVFMVYQLKENSDKYGLVYSAPMKKDTTLDKIYEDFSESTPNDFAGHTMGISDIVMFSDENGQRAFYLGEDGWEKIDTFIHEREDKRMDDKLKVLVVEPMCEPYVKEIDSGLESLQKEVGGLIQVTYPYEDLVGIVCNDERKINGMQLNRAIYDDNRNMTDIIAGTFLVVGLSDDSFTSLNDEQIKKFSDKFKMPEQFFKLGNEIVAFPVKPSIKKNLQLNNNEGIISTGKDSTNIIIKTSVKEQINQAKKEQGERNGIKPPSHKPPEI